jgi:DNA-binding MarR family transcriptional regulator
MTAAHPINDLDELVHQRVRLGILAVLAESTRADFTFLRDTLDLTDGNLARHLQTLESAGYIEIEKSFVRRRPRTWVRATTTGRAAFAREIAVLEALIRRVRKQ